MKFQTITSGSKGNCSILECGDIRLLIDIGVSYNILKRILEEKAISFDDFAGILITHNHKDHIKGLATTIKHTNLMVLIPKEMYKSLEEYVPYDRCVFIDDDYNLFNINIKLIHTSHDAPSSVGFIISYEGKSIVYVTDTGYINRKYLRMMVNKDIYAIESNHDEVMLMEGPYPYYLKERIISDLGHLSNKTTAKYLKSIIGPNTKYVLLTHLSETNNTKELAYTTVKNEINNPNITLKVATQDEESEIIEV